MENRKVNGHYHDPLDLNSQCTITIEPSSSSFSSMSFFTPSKSLPLSTPPLPTPPSTSSSVGVGVGGGGLSYIEHPVSKLDTLAGVAIKYGVEVADVKKINGLVTDHQMFALKTLHIPLPGRHPPSPILSNVSDQEPSSSERPPSSRRHSDFFDSFHLLKLKSSPTQKVSPSMSSLRCYYGLKPAEQKLHSEGCEMAEYRNGVAHYLADGPFMKSAPSNPPLSLHRKSKSVANGLYTENGDLANQEARGNDSDRWIEKIIRRRQKSEVDLRSRTPDMLLKEENNPSGGLWALASKGLALRPKSAGRNTSGTDAEGGFQNGLGESFVAESINGVRKSSSTPSLQDPESTSSLSSMWSTSKWNLKPDLQALSTARKSKAALD